MVHEIWQCPDDAVTALVLAHGAGAGMRHRNMQAIADAFALHGIATLRFDFPFIEAGRKRVDSPAVATARIAAAFRSAGERTRLPLWLGGHSFGGRMASHAVLTEQISPAGLVFCSFPLHAAGQAGHGARASPGADSSADAVPVRYARRTRDTGAARARRAGAAHGEAALARHRRSRLSRAAARARRHGRACSKRWLARRAPSSTRTSRDCNRAFRGGESSKEGGRRSRGSRRRGTTWSKSKRLFACWRSRSSPQRAAGPAQIQS